MVKPYFRQFYEQEYSRNTKSFTFNDVLPFFYKWAGLFVNFKFWKKILNLRIVDRIQKELFKMRLNSQSKFLVQTQASFIRFIHNSMGKGTLIFTKI